MAFHKNVNNGDKFKPDAQLSNDVRNLLNSLNGMSEKAIDSNSVQVTKISVYNPGTALLYANMAVEVDVNCQVYNNTYPVKMSLNGAGSVGVLTQPLASGQCGSMVTSGVVQVPVFGGVVKAFVRIENGGFWYADSGMSVIHGTPESASINLGGGGGDSGGVAVYDGPFTVQLTTNILDPTIRQLLVCNPSATQQNKTMAGEVEVSNYNGIAVTAEYLPITTGYVYLKLQADGENLTAEFVQSATRLSSTTYIEYVQLAQIECNEYGAVEICQIWRSGNVRINYRWW